MTAARTLFVALAALTAIGATSASAFDGDRRRSFGDSGRFQNSDEVDRRQNNQERRIQDGARSGEINRREYRALEIEQARIRELERRAKADGRVDPYEAAQLRRAQNEASRHIRDESTDRDHRGSWFRRWW